MRTLSIVLLAVGAACGGAAVALASVGLTLFTPGSPAVPRLNAAALSLALVGALAGILAAPVRRRADRAESRGSGSE